VSRGTISQTLSITGTADAELSSNLVFQSTGIISGVNVRVGDVVQQGQLLASLESDDLQNTVAVAQSNLAAARLRLEDLVAGTDAPDLAAAEQAVASAQAGVTKAQNDYDDLLTGGSTADAAAAEQAVRAAEAQLATAVATRDQLSADASDADVAAAEAGVTSAQSGLTSAENAVANAANSLVTTGAALKSAETAYCDKSPSTVPAFCGARATPISSGDAALMDAALSGENALEASSVISANSAYLAAVNGKGSADAALASAQDALMSAEARLDALNDGADDADIAAAEAAVASAQAGLTTARERLLQLQAGGTDTQQANAASALISAQASLDASEARREQAYSGPELNAIEQAREAVRAAQLQVEAAEIRLRNASIEAPFAGTVASVNIKVGEFFGGAASLAEGAGGAIVLLTPDSLTLSMSVGETDYRTLKVGQGGVAIFDGLPGSVYPFTISEIGLSPTITQGVVTYPVEASIIVLPDSPRPAPGMNARGQITTDSKPDVLVIPSRAIRIQGTDQVVDRKTGSGTEAVVVTTGATDGQNVEVVTGLDENDIIVVVTLTSGQETGGAAAEPTLPGGIR
jgi:HlyD family secretion protein